jgi:hypothetical protein
MDFLWMVTMVGLGFNVWINPKFTTLNPNQLNPKDQLNFGEIHFLFEYFLNATYRRKIACFFSLAGRGGGLCNVSMKSVNRETIKMHPFTNKMNR